MANSDNNTGASNKQLIVPVFSGKLIAEASTDPNYPGINIEFIPDYQPINKHISNPRVLIEMNPELTPDDIMSQHLNVYTWANAFTDDFSNKERIELPLENKNEKVFTENEAERLLTVWKQYEPDEDWSYLYSIDEPDKITGFVTLEKDEDAKRQVDITATENGYTFAVWEGIYFIHEIVVDQNFAFVTRNFA